MLTGSAPFAGESGGMAKMWAHLNAEPPSVREQRPDVPAAARRRDPPGAGQAPGRPALGRGVRAAALAAVGEAALARLAASSASVVEHVAARAPPTRRRSRSGEPRSSAAAASSSLSRPVLAGGVGRPGRGHEHDRMLRARPPACRRGRARPGSRPGVRPSNTGQARAAISRPAGSGSSAQPDERAHGVEAELGVAVGVGGRADRHRLAALDLRPSRAAAAPSRCIRGR